MNAMERKVFIAGLTAAIIAKTAEESGAFSQGYAETQATLFADGATGAAISDMTLQAAEIMGMTPVERQGSAT